MTRTEKEILKLLKIHDKCVKDWRREDMHDFGRGYTSGYNNASLDIRALVMELIEKRKAAKCK